MTAAETPRGTEEHPPIPEDALILVTLRNMILFPGVVLPVLIGRERSKLALQDAVRGELPIGLVMQMDGDEEEPAADGLHRVGTVASVLRYLTTPEGHHHSICQGESRFRVLEFLEGWPFFVARVERFEEDDEQAMSKEVEARFLHLKQQALEAIELLPQSQSDLSEAIQNMKSASMLADMVATFLDIPASDKQRVLETFDVLARIDLVSRFLAERLEVLRLTRDISRQTRGTLEKAQREYYLREQLKTIQKELGEEDPKKAEVDEIKKAILGAGMPDEIRKEAEKQLRRLEQMPEASAEYSVIRTYLDWLTELPWSVLSPDAIEVARAREILDEDHFDLEKVKKRILEFLAVRKLRPEGKSPILCFVGPPGVGKTSLGKSVARATGRNFVRISLGGIHDEAEIRGHRRTYVGALPGNIVQGVKKAGTRNPVFLLDEMDKLGTSFRGDPASALLEVLDPAQNSTFRDHYLAVPFDLSRVMFIGTANMTDTIPGPLLDRLEIIRLPGYTEEDKVQIAKRYLIPRQIEENGLSAEQCEIPEPTIREVISSHTREAGCRNLERELAAVCRNVATRIAEGTAQRAVVQPGDLPAILGPAKFESELAMRTSVPGVATGLAWTPVGGDILFVEATRMRGTGRLILTGQLGDVMKESAQAAESLVKSRAESIGVDAEELARSDVHVHVPAGAIPKDGPSAGVAMYVALVSLLTRRTVRSDVAMTGEISLRGLVLPIGGVKEKVLAAHRAGITTVILPRRNRKDFEEIPAEVRSALRFVWVERVEEAVSSALDLGSEAAPATSPVGGEPVHVREE